MNELSLFTGAGGGLLGTKLLGFRSIGYVEINEYCQKVIAARIADGILDRAPIFGDVRAFVRDGYAASYTGMVDVLTAGFPCQPFSSAGKRLGEGDPRNMWPATDDVIRLVRPRFAFLENVPGLLASGYFGTVLADLHALGYDARWTVLSAAGCGAPHTRKRLWILAADTVRGAGSPEQERQHQRPEIADRGRQGWMDAGDDVADAECSRGRKPAGTVDPARQSFCQAERQESAFVAGSGGEDVSDPDRDGCQRAEISVRPWRQGQETPESGWDCREIPNTCIQGLPVSEHEREYERPVTKPCWWTTEPAVGRVAHGVACRVDRLKAAGNGQVPAVVAEAWQVLTSGI